MAIRNYYLGCPGWGASELHPPGTRAVDHLEGYARAFNSVEGNTSFYALPSAEAIARWRDQVPDEFRFCFKFPRAVTHDKLLVEAAREVGEFLERVAPLGAKLGTLMLQLPARFDGSHVPRLAQFLESLPRDFHYAVELRHEAFFGETAAARAAMALLTERGVDVVVLDTRGVHSSTSLAMTEVRARKPKLPLIVRSTAQQPFVRCVPHETFEAGKRFVEEWAPRIGRWIAEGKRPYFFMHAPDETRSPANAYAFHAMLQQHADVGELPPWPGGPRQLALL